jgi:hypothetical protein
VVGALGQDGGTPPCRCFSPIPAICNPLLHPSCVLQAISPKPSSTPNAGPFGLPFVPSRTTDTFSAAVIAHKFRPANHTRVLPPRSFVAKSLNHHHLPSSAFLSLVSAQHQPGRELRARPERLETPPDARFETIRCFSTTGNDVACMQLAYLG